MMNSDDSFPINKYWNFVPTYSTSSPSVPANQNYPNALIMLNSEDEKNTADCLLPHSPRSSTTHIDFLLKKENLTPNRSTHANSNEEPCPTVVQLTTDVMETSVDSTNRDATSQTSSSESSSQWVHNSVEEETTSYDLTSDASLSCRSFWQNPGADHGSQLHESEMHLTGTLRALPLSPSSHVDKDRTSQSCLSTHFPPACIPIGNYGVCEANCTVSSATESNCSMIHPVCSVSSTATSLCCKSPNSQLTNSDACNQIKSSHSNLFETNTLFVPPMNPLVQNTYNPLNSLSYVFPFVSTHMMNPNPGYTWSRSFSPGEPVVNEVNPLYSVEANSSLSSLYDSTSYERDTRSPLPSGTYSGKYYGCL